MIKLDEHQIIEQDGEQYIEVYPGVFALIIDDIENDENKTEH